MVTYESQCCMRFSYVLGLCHNILQYMKGLYGGRLLRHVGYSGSAPDHMLIGHTIYTTGTSSTGALKMLV